MENLVFANKTQRLVKRIIGAVIILASVFLIIQEWNSMKRSNIIFGMLLFLVGVINFTPFSGSDKSGISVSSENLKIWWRGWVREVTVSHNEIESIILERLFITINRKGKKPIKLPVDFLEMEQRTRIFEFLIEYGKINNIAIER